MFPKNQNKMQQKISCNKILVKILHQVVQPSNLT